MKQTILALIMLLASMMTSNAANKVYYVVQGSYSSLEKATDANELEAPIYEVTTNGKTVYRLCPACFYSKEDAQEYARAVKQALGKDAWVSTCNGLEKCVYGSDMNDVTPMKATPKSTTIYYVVGGSYSSLAAAREYNKKCPDSLEATIIKSTVKGKTMYRAVVGCYLDKDEAHKDANLINENYKTDFWVLPSKGRAKVAEYGVNLRGSIIWLDPK